jgi:HEAT repeat protein
MLGRVLTDSDPFSDDHALVLDMLGAVAQLGDERAVSAVVLVMRRKRFFRRARARAFKHAAVQALIAIGTADAVRALDEAARDGDRLLRRVIRETKR